MPEPVFSDLLGETIETTDEESSNLICLCDAARISAAYWKGRCEALEQAIAEIKSAHQREVAGLKAGFEATLGYLKDRLNRLEVKPQD